MQTHFYLNNSRRTVKTYIASDLVTRHFVPGNPSDSEHPTCPAQISRSGTREILCLLLLFLPLNSKHYFHFTMAKAEGQRGSERC